MSTSFKTLRANRPSLAARDPRCNEVSVVAISLGPPYASARQSNRMAFPSPIADELPHRRPPGQSRSDCSLPRERQPSLSQLGWEVASCRRKNRIISADALGPSGSV